MKPRTAFNGSIKDAHNTDDLNERWQIRKDESEDDSERITVGAMVVVDNRTLARVAAYHGKRVTVEAGTRRFTVKRQRLTVFKKDEQS